jgi:UDP-N-acetylmuramate--alanine ligase
MADSFGLRDDARIHIVGAGGAGMSGVAKLMSQRGHVVSGSDLKPGRALDALGDLGIETWIGHAPDRVADVDLVVASSAVPARDVELGAAREAGVPVWSRPDFLDALTSEFPTIGFTGTHGKTTSTALAVTALRSTGHDPSFLLGGELSDLNTGAHLGDGSRLLLEADEAYGTFRRLHLEGLVVTNIEPDHLDYYGNVATLEEAFALVANRTRGPVLGCIDDAGVRRLAERAPVITYGTAPGAQWRITDRAHGEGRVTFTLTGPEAAATVEVPRPGDHVARNAAGVLALLSELGYSLEATAAGLRDFGGVRRRFDVRARIAGVTVVDDYAHHPTEIAATIAAGRLGGWTRVWAVFQPHRYTRTADLAPEFGDPLSAADHVVVTGVYAAGEAPLPGVSGRLVAEAVAAAGGDVEYVPSLGNVSDLLVPRLQPGDLVLLLGAGDVTTLAEPIARSLEAAR